MLHTRQIEAFQAVMQAGGMTGAAELLHVTQPAVSRLIRDLELEVGFTLFLRRGNVIEPTLQAHIFHEEVARSFTGLRKIAAFARDVRMGHGRQLRIGMLPAMATGFLPRFMAQFSRLHPQLRIVADGLPSREVSEQVMQGYFDLGLVSVPVRHGALVATPFNDEAVVVVPEGHAYADAPEISAQMLAGQPLILLGKLLDGRHSIQAELQAVAPSRVIETSLSSIAGAMAMAGAGLAVIDPFSANEFALQGAVVRPFRPRLAIGTGLIRSSERALSAIAAEFEAAFLAHVTVFLTRDGAA